jgi:hypothetical protein
VSIFDLPEIEQRAPAEPDLNFGEAIASAAASGELEIPMVGNRYSLPDAHGKIVVWNGATTFAETLDNSYPLKVHGERQVARGMAVRPDLCAKVAADPDNKDMLKEVLKEAKSAAADKSEANWGTALHAVFARFDRGEPLEQINELFHPDIKARQAKLEFYGITVLPEYRERVVRCLSLGVSGRLDWIGQLPDGTLVIGDDKSEKDPQEYTSAKKIQLATYANSGELMNYHTNELEPMPAGLHRDFALIVHTRPLSGECEIYEVDIADGWAGAILAKQVSDWRKRTGGIFPYVTERSWVPKAVAVNRPDYCVTCEELLCPTCGECVSGQCPRTACTCEIVSAPGELEVWASTGDGQVEPTMFGEFLGVTEPTRTPDEQTEADDLIKELKLDKPGWQVKYASLGMTDIDHHIRTSVRGTPGLALLYVRERNRQGMTEREWRERQATRAFTQEPGYTQEQALKDIASAGTEVQMRAVYDKWVAAHGTESWKGSEVYVAAVAKMKAIKNPDHPLS